MGACMGRICLFIAILVSFLGVPVHGGDVLWGSGQNPYYLMGDTSITAEIFREIALPEGCRVSQVFMNPTVYRSFLLCDDGRLFAAGKNDEGSLCLGFTMDALRTQVTLPIGKTLKAVAAGGFHTILHMTDGSLYGCGLFAIPPEASSAENCPTFGAILPSQLSPVSLAITGKPADRTVVQVCSMFYATVLLLDNGDLYGAGSNEEGRLGLGSSVTSASSFTKIPLPSGRKATAIACTYRNIAAILDDGSVATCGRGDEGENGDGTYADVFTLKIVAMPGTGRKAASVAFASYRLVVRSTGGIISGSGYNADGQLGQGTTTNIPVLTDISIPGGVTATWASGSYCGTLAYTTDRRLLAAGDGTYGQFFMTNTTKKLVMTESDLLTTGLGMVQGISVFSTATLAWGLAAPTMNGVSPATALAGSTVTVTLTGTHFRQEASAVTVGGLPCANPVVANGTLRCSTDPALTAGSHDVVVTNTDVGLNATLSEAFKLTLCSPSLSQPAGRPGDRVTVTGCGFTATCRVQLGATGIELATTLLSATVIEFVVPAQPSAANITYEVILTETATGEQSPPSAGATFSYAPTVSALSVRHGPAAAATTVTVTGTNFASGAVVRLGTEAAHLDLTPVAGTTTSISLIFVVPSQASSESQLGSFHSGQWAVAVANPASAGWGLSAETGPALTFSYEPTVTAVNPSRIDRAATESSLTVTGRNLYSGAAVHLTVAAGGSGTGSAPSGGDITPTSITPMPAALMGSGVVYSSQTAVTIQFYRLPAVISVSGATSNDHSPLLAKGGDQVTVNFTVNVALDTNPSVLPVVTVAGRGAAVTLDAWGATFTAVVTMVSGDPQGNLTYALSGMRDPQGDPQAPSSITGTLAVVFDSVAPRLIGVTGGASTGGSRAQVGDQVTLTLQADESLDGGAAGTMLPTVTLAGRAAAVQLVGPSTVRATVTLREGDPLGPIGYTLSGSLCDLAGNCNASLAPASGLTGITFELMLSARVWAASPVIVSGSVRFTSDNPNGPARARVGDRLAVRLTSSEPLGAATVAIAGHALSATPLDGQAATEWGASWVVRPEDCAAEEGVARLLAAAVVNATDQAGNPLPGGTTPVAATATVELDCTRPRLSRVTFTSSNAALAGVAQPGDLLTVRLTATEPLRVTADSRLVIAGHSVTVTAAADLMWSFEASYRLTGADSPGPVGFTVPLLADLAGNTIEAAISTPTDGPAVIFFERGCVYLRWSVICSLPSLLAPTGSNCTQAADCGTAGGLCVAVGAGTFGCRCAPGRSGARCETVEGTCTVDGDCHNGGSCQGTAPAKACTCAPAWTGDHCHMPDVYRCHTDGDCQAAGDAGARCIAGLTTTAGGLARVGVPMRPGRLRADCHPIGWELADLYRCRTDAECQTTGDTGARCLAGLAGNSTRLWECQCAQPGYTVTATPSGGTTCSPLTLPVIDVYRCHTDAECQATGDTGGLSVNSVRLWECQSAATPSNGTASNGTACGPVATPDVYRCHTDGDCQAAGDTGARCLAGLATPGMRLWECQCAQAGYAVTTTTSNSTTCSQHLVWPSLWLATLHPIRALHFVLPRTDVYRCHTDGECQAGGDAGARCAAGLTTTAGGRLTVLWECQCAQAGYAVTATPSGGTTCSQLTTTVVDVYRCQTDGDCQAAGDTGARCVAGSATPGGVRLWECQCAQTGYAVTTTTSSNSTTCSQLATPVVDVYRCQTDAECQAAGDTGARCMAGSATPGVRLWECQCAQAGYAVTATPSNGTTCSPVATPDMHRCHTDAQCQAAGDLGARCVAAMTTNAGGRLARLWECQCTQQDGYAVHGAACRQVATPVVDVYRCQTDADCQAAGDTGARCTAGLTTPGVRLWECQCAQAGYAPTGNHLQPNVYRCQTDAQCQAGGDTGVRCVAGLAKTARGRSARLWECQCTQAGYAANGTTCSQLATGSAAAAAAATSSVGLWVTSANAGLLLLVAVGLVAVFVCRRGGTSARHPRDDQKELVALGPTPVVNPLVPRGSAASSGKVFPTDPVHDDPAAPAPEPSMPLVAAPSVTLPPVVVVQVAAAAQATLPPDPLPCWEPE
ncbi:putative regulator of chromosome condensation RCC1 [Paratrimastix pyriformis]|uniref:Regulator of chromosome condensation RCC1 n=1 Tax=Paratrimastix pyriformis TaxID=342808 RepID=A0ABQ8UJS9_9EUKA|nr:putative regulator of chromosome condensation RCC1 [Paratrimastix pyriformis]